MYDNFALIFFNFEEPNFQSLLTNFKISLAQKGHLIFALTKVSHFHTLLHINTPTLKQLYMT